MYQQPYLPGFDRAIADRLFFALLPDKPAAARAAMIAHRLRDQFQLTGEPFQRERFHVSLYHLGDYAGVPNAILAKAIEAASTVAAPPFEVVFDRAASFASRRRRRPLVLRGDQGSPPLADFHHALGRAMKGRGLGRWVGARFTPHVTLLYDRRHIEAREVEPVAWIAREFVLIHSLIGQTRHVPLGRWPIGR